LFFFSSLPFFPAFFSRRKFHEVCTSSLERSTYREINGNEALPNVHRLSSNHKMKSVGNMNINIYFCVSIPTMLIKLIIKTDTI